MNEYRQIDTVGYIDRSLRRSRKQGWHSNQSSVVLNSLYTKHVLGSSMKLPARIVLLLFSLFVSGAIPSLARAKADELPADTNSIQSLTVEQARQLVSERQQMREEHRDSDDSILDVIRILNPDSAAAMAAARGGDLTLPALKSLDASTAEALQEFEGHLSLPGLKEIDVAVAHALEGFQGDLSLDGLETLDPSVAKALAELWCKRLSLGIGWLDARTAKVLAKAQCDQLILQRLGLGAGVAEALAEFGGHLHCSGGNRISPDAAKALAGCKCLSLSLDGITSLDAITAEGLAQTKAGLTFNVTSLRYDAAKALGQSKCRALTFSSLKTLHSDAASALAEFTGHLHLSISSLDGDSARSLLEGRSASLLIACGVGQGLDEKTAEAIERSNKKCWLDPEATSAAAAEWAVKTSGRTLRFRREEIDSEIAKVLVQFKGDGIQLDEVESLSVGAAKAIAAFAGRRLSLSGLKTLDSQVAAALAAFKGERLSLNALEAVTADVARALSGFGGQRLDLANLTSLDAGALHALAECKGERLYIPTVMRRIGNEIPLDAVTARLVCASYGEVVLPSVVALESADAVDVALALAQRKGPLSIPNLKKITPKTLAALKLKKDVVLPSEGTLTFVPDSYDYVTLAWLEKERPRAVTVLEAKALLAGMKRSLKALDLQSVTALDAATEIGRAHV